MNKEEKEKYYKLAIELGEIIGKYGKNEQIELFQKMLDDYKIKNSEYFRLKKENTELKEENEKLKKLCNKATEIIDEFADTLEEDNKKIHKYRVEKINNVGGDIE